MCGTTEQRYHPLGMEGRWAQLREVFSGLLTPRIPAGCVRLGKGGFYVHVLVCLCVHVCERICICVRVCLHVNESWFRWRENHVYKNLEISMVASSKKGKNPSV